MNTETFNPELGVIKTDTFSSVYPVVNHYIWTTRPFEQSRDGEVKELLDVKTNITNPYRRCVGGYHRNINIFFLLAEAMWIAAGRKDVEFLTIFNKQMAEYSDDGKVFHAPYGYRLRHWGVAPEEEFANRSVENAGYDQVVNAIRILSENPNSRQVVMEIWNPLLDLGHATKDIPCNDIVMLKIRDGKLITTIGNRSNDLHWGLPTNVFQFSFLTELIASSLGIELGTQTHNSQSLHIYKWNKLAETMDNEYSSIQDGEDLHDLYVNYGAVERHMDFNFKTDLPVNRFREIDYHINLVLDNIQKVANGEDHVDDEIKQIGEFSSFLKDVYTLLEGHLVYKRKIADAKTPEEKDAVRMEAFKYVRGEVEGRIPENVNWDVVTLAENFYAARLQLNNPFVVLGTL